MAKDQKYKQRQEKRMIRKIYSLLTKQRKWVESNMEDLSFFQEKDKDKRENRLNPGMLQKNTIENEIEVLLDQLPYKKDLATEIVTFMKLAIKRGGKQLVKELDLKNEYGISFDVTNPRATQFLQEKEVWELSNAQGNIDGTTKKRLKGVLIDAHDTGKSYNETAKKIQGLSKAGVFSKERGKLIAVREIGVAYEEGNAEVINEFRSKYAGRQVLKKWQTVNDARVTATHKENQGNGWIDYNQAFTGTGDQHAPGSDNPRCRCFTKYKIPKKK